MVLLSLLIFNKLFYPQQLKLLSTQLTRKNMNHTQYKLSITLNTLWFSIIFLFLLFNIAPAILIASNCHHNSPLHIIISILFSDIYIFHFAINKFIFHNKC